MTKNMIGQLNARKRLRGAWLWMPCVGSAFAALIIILTGIDRDVFLLANNAGRFAADPFWAHVTLMGDTSVALLVMLPFVGRRPDRLFALAVTGAAGTLFVHTLKPALGLPRPPAVIDPALIHVIGPALKARAFPSGHTATAFGIAGVLILTQRNKAVWAIALIPATMVGLSRIAVGVHWPTDVCGGIFFGWLAAVTGAGAARNRRWSGARRVYHALAIIVLANGFYTLIWHQTRYPGTRMAQRIFAAAMLICGGIEYYRAVAGQRGTHLESGPHNDIRGRRKV